MAVRLYLLDQIVLTDPRGLLFLFCPHKNECSNYVSPSFRFMTKIIQVFNIWLFLLTFYDVHISYQKWSTAFWFIHIFLNKSSYFVQITYKIRQREQYIHHNNHLLIEDQHNNSCHTINTPIHFKYKKWYMILIWKELIYCGCVRYFFLETQLFITIWLRDHVLLFNCCLKKVEWAAVVLISIPAWYRAYRYIWIN